MTSKWKKMMKRRKRRQVWANYFYRVTHLVDSNLMLTSKEKFHFGLARSGQAGQYGTFVLMSMGGLNQQDVSPCTELQYIADPRLRALSPYLFALLKKVSPR